LAWAGELPDHRKNLSHVINAGVYIFEPKALEHFDSATKLERDVFPKLVEQGKLAGYLFAGQWFDVGNPASYEQAIKEWKE